MKHSVSTSHHSATSALDAYDFDDASAATQEIVDACKRRNCQVRENAKRLQFNNQRVMTTSDSFRFSDVRAQDPTAYAHLLADHFVAREASNAATSVTPVRTQQSVKPAAGAVSLGSFRSWQFGERCLATYRVLFGRPLWGSNVTSVPLTSPRPKKRKHMTTMNSDGCSVDQTTAGELEGGIDMLPLPTVDELLELPTEDSLELDGKETAPLEEDVLAGLAIDLEEGLGPDTAGDGIDLLWDLDANEVDGGAMMTESDFLSTSPSAFTSVSPDEVVEDI